MLAVSSSQINWPSIFYSPRRHRWTTATTTNTHSSLKFSSCWKLKVDANCLKQQDIARYPWVKEVVEEEGTHLQSIRSFMVMVWWSNIFTCDNPNTSDDLVDAALVLPAHSHLASAWPFCSHVALLLKMIPYVNKMYIYDINIIYCIHTHNYTEFQNTVRYTYNLHCTLYVIQTSYQTVPLSVFWLQFQVHFSYNQGPFLCKGLLAQFDVDWLSAFQVSKRFHPKLKLLSNIQLL